MNKGNLRIALVQMNSTVGAMAANKDKILKYVHQAMDAECDLIAFPELAIIGYPPEDLLLRWQFIADQQQILQEIARRTPEIIAVVGYVERTESGLFNTAAVLHNGRHVASYHKVHLPNYSVFDEERYFESGRTPLLVQVEDLKIGISICEDIWIADSVVEAEALLWGADLLLNISASPYFIGKTLDRERLMQNKAQRTHSTVAYVNLVGGQDELVFDGHSIVADAQGRLLLAQHSFEEEMHILDLDVADLRASRQERAAAGRIFPSAFLTAQIVTVATQIKSKKSAAPAAETRTPARRESEVYAALLLGLRDYVKKNVFQKVTLGLSGGIDSALVTALAVDALGAENVIAVSMPSQYSSTGSVADAQQLVQNLGIQLLVYPIADIFDQYKALLAETFTGLPENITEENLQARIRGNLLMALSNKFGWMVLVTGNKSEVSVGYCTLYGDTAGGFAPLKDVFKTLVYALCEHRNSEAGYDLIPRAIIEKAPSAELRPNQTDQDSLPPYDVLDAILELYVEYEMGVAEIAKRGFEGAVVHKVARLVDSSEYKRRQAAPGIKITPRAFGKDRRMPITNAYRS